MFPILPTEMISKTAGILQGLVEISANFYVLSVIIPLNGLFGTDHLVKAFAHHPMVFAIVYKWKSIFQANPLSSQGINNSD